MTCDWANRRVPVPIHVQIEAALASVPLEKRVGYDRDLETEPTHESEYKARVRIREAQVRPVVQRMIGQGRCRLNDLWSGMPFLHKSSSRCWLSGYMLNLVESGVVLGRKVPSRSGPTWEFYRFVNNETSSRPSCQSK